MATIIKPSFSGLNASHPRYARVHKFYNFGTDSRELVGNVALTLANMALVNDADVGDARSLVNGSSMTQGISIPQDCTVIVVLAGRGGRNTGTGDDATIIGNGLTNNAINFGYNYGSGGRFTVSYRGASGSSRGNLYTDAFTSNGQFATGLAIGTIYADTETMITSVNGVTQTATNTTASNTFASSPISMTLGHSVGATANFALAAIIVLTGISSESELNADTTDPWAFLSQAPAITNIDGDNSVNQGQQSVIINMSNVPTTVASWSASIGGNALTAVSWNNNQTATVHIPANLAAGGSQQLSVTYTE